MPQNEHIELHRSVQNFEKFSHIIFFNSEQGQVIFKSRYRFYFYVSVSSSIVHVP